MTIKHIVIGGGGIFGFRYLSALKRLNESNFWKIDDIVSIYATSIGTLIAVCLVLKYDWDTLETYVVDRPWKDVFKISGKQLFDSYSNKGVYDVKIVEQSLKPLLLGKDININITMLELYELTKIDLHFMTVNLNKFETIDLNYKTHPNIRIIDAVYMSSSIPGVFSPICEEINGEKLCYVDGGVLDNFPINKCIQNLTANETDEILGITLDVKDSEQSRSVRNIIVSQETNILEFFSAFFTNFFYYTRYHTLPQKMKYKIVCYIEGNEFTFDFIKTVINDKEIRKQLFQQGFTDCDTFFKEHSEQIALKYPS